MLRFSRDNQKNSMKLMRFSTIQILLFLNLFSKFRVCISKCEIKEIAKNRTWKFDF